MLGAEGMREVVPGEAGNISDVSPLANLTSLTSLNLSENQISDIFPLSERAKYVPRSAAIVAGFPFVLDSTRVVDDARLVRQTRSALCHIRHYKA